MSIREIIQRNSAVTTSATLIILIAALIAIVLQFVNSRTPGAVAKEAYFSTDDGATWFVDDIQKVPPFVKGDKQAVRVHLFRCGSDKPFVAFLSRYSDEGKKVIEDAFAKAKTEKAMPPNDHFMDSMRIRYGEIKKPGGSEWVNETRNENAYTAIMKFTCSNGNLDDLEMIMP